jgi:7-cyano-7-deazaguanine synthase in queuosine biosynthesis
MSAAAAAKRVVDLCRTVCDVLDELDRSYSCTDPVDGARDCGECYNCLVFAEALRLMEDEAR